MRIAFILSMPGNNSWDGKWSGDGRLFAVVREFSDSRKGREHTAKILAQPSYGYDFGDGWRARVDVHQVDTKEARRIRKESQGFLGYDWMIDSIRDHGKILADHQLPKAVQS